MKCHCGKVLTEKTVATKSHQENGHTIVDATRQALVCSDHGVVAWDPIRQTVNLPYVPVYPIQPWPITPARPYVQPYGTWPQTVPRWNLTCDSAGSAPTLGQSNTSGSWRAIAQ